MSADPVAKFIMNSSESSSDSADNGQAGGKDQQPQSDNICEEPPRRSAMFGLSQSDFGCDSEVGSACGDRGSLSSLHFDEFDDDIISRDSDTAISAFTNRKLRLSAILAISADEKLERKVSRRQDDDNTDVDKSGIVQSFFEDREFDFLKSEPVRRCTSLKTGKKSGSGNTEAVSGLKKVVRFADVLGLDLESVRHIMNNDEPPLVPASAMKDLKLRDASDAGSDKSDENLVSKTDVDVCHLCFCFSQPGCAAEFMRRVEERRVSLESCIADDAVRQLSGIVRVANIAFHKRVVVRFTVNGWLTFTDEEATYLVGSHDGRTDCFRFLIKLPDYFGFGSRMEFSVLYEAGGDAFWDSNFGGNYRVECYMKPEAPHGLTKGLKPRENRFY